MKFTQDERDLLTDALGCRVTYLYKAISRYSGAMHVQTRKELYDTAGQCKQLRIRIIKQETGQ